jgi:hypothetical protein
MPRATSWLAAIFFVGCLVLGYLLHRQEALLAALAQQSDTAGKTAQQRISELEHRLTAAEAGQAAAKKSAAQAAANASAAGANGTSDSGPVVIHIGDILRDHPEYAALYAKQLRRDINRMYGTSLDRLNLPPDQLAHLKDLLVERQMDSIDAQGAATAAGLKQGTPDFRAAMQQATQGVEQQLTAILGSNADSTLTQLQVQNTMQNQVMSGYAPDFADAGVPLNAEQAAGLTQAMADANYGGKDLSTRPANYNIPDPATGLSPHDDRIIAAASQVLTPEQVQVLKNDQIATEAQATALKAYNPGGRPVMLMP